VKKPLIVSIALVLVVAASAGIAWWLTDRNSASTSWLFAGAAEAGTLTPKSDGTFTLTLTGIDDDVLAFTDRPQRDVAVLDPQVLPEYWEQWFADSNPNAVLVEHEPGGDSDSTVMVLANPTLTGAKPDRTLTFDAELVSEAIPESVQRLAGKVKDVPPSDFDRVSVFIDGAISVPVSNGKGGTTSVPITWSLENWITTPYSVHCPPGC